MIAAAAAGVFLVGEMAEVLPRSMTLAVGRELCGLVRVGVARWCGRLRGADEVEAAGAGCAGPVGTQCRSQAAIMPQRAGDVALVGEQPLVEVEPSCVDLRAGVAQQALDRLLVRHAGEELLHAAGAPATALASGEKNCPATPLTGKKAPLKLTMSSGANSRSTAMRTRIAAPAEWPDGAERR